MRVLRLTRAHPAQFRARRLAGITEPTAAASIIQRSLAYRTSDGFEQALASLGHRAQAVVVNDRLVQEDWARRHGLPPRTPLLAIAAQQVREFQPDVVYVGDIDVVPPAWLTELRAQVNSIRAVVAWIGAVHDDVGHWQTADLVLSCVPELIHEYADRGPMALLRHGFDQRALDELPPRDPQPHVLAAFQLQRTPGRHEHRVQVLEDLVDRGVPLEIRAPQYDREWANELRFGARRLAWRADRLLGRVGVSPRTRDRFVAFRKIRRWEELPPSWRSPILQPRLQPAIWGRALFEQMRLSAITLNVHADVSSRHASNLRLFEATGVGSCLVTEAHHDLSELFDPDREVVTWTSVDDLAEKLRWLLEHPAQAEAIAAAGQRRTLREHRLVDRAADWLELVEPLL